MQTWTIPAIDIGAFTAGEQNAIKTIAGDVDWACRNIGFLLISNHGVSQELINDAFAVSMGFFELPIEEKNRLRPTDASIPRGYQAFASRNLAKTFGIDAPPDLREQFFIGPPSIDRARVSKLPQAQIFYAENIWPQQPPRFRSVFERYYEAMNELSKQLMKIFAVALELPADYFDDKIDCHFNTCPTNHYPVVRQHEPGQLRAGEHTDFGSLTILAFNDAPGGLQVRMPDESWFDVRAQPGQLVVNIGDMMARWTNDRWKSTIHRVVNPAQSSAQIHHRQSIGYFLHPNFDTEVACLESCQGPNNPPRYAPIMAGEHMREKLLRRVESPSQMPSG